MKRYAAAIVALREMTFTLGSLSIRAGSKEEALGIALLTCKTKLPLKDGYHSHNVCVSLVPRGEAARQEKFTQSQINLLERLVAEWLAGNNLADDLEANSIYDFIDFVKQFERNSMEYKTVRYEIQVRAIKPDFGFVGITDALASIERTAILYDEFKTNFPDSEFRILRIETVTTVIKSSLEAEGI